ncbi:DUF3953 domain-containing protein [Rossellomorea aquimaris]|uniref:DUF3953 domain-containing protein n=1 Tax=Rossellomorea aquimaris TaxID=189382 RepID=UPI001CD55F7B|nr:DUF3953 domain-containing protein [Rossellomorea aquimaris]MCA1055832.1 DUF3953 domain-containing protein [Rossellomorea aquimaris]
MLKILRKIISLIALAFAGHGLITDNVDSLPIVIFLMGVMMVVMGMEEFQKKRKVGYVFWATSILCFSVLI